MTRKTLNILILSDGRAGHLNRSNGVVLALSKRCEVNVEVVELMSPKVLPKALLPKMAGIMNLAVFLKFFHPNLAAKVLKKPDVIVSAGGSTLGANSALASRFEVPNIYAGKLRGMPKGTVALSFPPYMIKGEACRSDILWPPVNVDPEDFAAVGDLVDLKKCSIGFLIGGATKSVAFSDADWRKIAGLIKDISAKFAAVKVATSPRTPNAAYDAFSGIAEVQNVEFIDYRNAGIGSAKKIFACDVVCPTLDSSSMITEAIAAKRMVVAISAQNELPSADADLLSIARNNKWFEMMNVNFEDAEDLCAKLSEVKPVEVNHLDILADAIFAALPDLS